jgi:hypothetical protein
MGLTSLLLDHFCFALPKRVHGGGSNVALQLQEVKEASSNEYVFTLHLDYTVVYAL